jgi:hypothetical protein
MIEPKDLILKEIEIVQSEIARFDNNGLTVKEWCLAVWAGLIAYGVQHSESLIIAAAFVTTISFSFVELMYRRYQLRFISRSKHIEQMLASKNLTEYKYAVHSSAVGERGKFWTELTKALLLPHFYIFYIILAEFALACTAYIYLRPA